MNDRIQAKTVLALLRVERKAAADKHDALAVKKIDFIGKSIVALLEKQ